jgi:hypothetical protein
MYHSGPSSPTSASHRPISTTQYQQRAAYYPSDMFPRYSASSSRPGEDAYYRHHESPREGIGDYSPQDYYHETDFTLAEHQELSRYYQGDEKYPLEADILYQSYSREADVLSSALDSRHTPLDGILSARLDGRYRSVTSLPSALSLTAGTNDATFEQIHLTQPPSKWTNHHLSERVVAAAPTAAVLPASMLTQHSYPVPQHPLSSMNRSHLTYPIEPHHHLNPPTDLCENENHSNPSSLHPYQRLTAPSFTPDHRYPPIQTAPPRQHRYSVHTMHHEDGYHDLSSSSPSLSDSLPVTRTPSASLLSGSTTSSATPSSTSSFTSSF